MRIYRKYHNKIIRSFVDDNGDEAIELSTRNGSFLISASDLEKVKRFGWNITVDVNGKKYVTTKKKNKNYYFDLHRFLMEETNPEIVIDHVNSDGTDNRRSNLRRATYRQNSFNRIVSKRSSTGIKGVFFDKERNKYVARIKVDGKYKNLGRFEDINDAANAYKEAAELHYKEFSRLSSLDKLDMPIINTEL